jgi:hypothetical protein
MSGPQWRPTAGVGWVVERLGVTLLRQGRPPERLQHPEAPLWDLLTRGIAGGRLAVMMAALVDSDPAVAARFVADTAERWVRQGWLERDEHDG